MLKNKLRKRLGKKGWGCRSDRGTPDSDLPAAEEKHVSGRFLFPPRAGSLCCGFNTAMPLDRPSILWLRRHQWYEGSTQIKASIAQLHLATQ